MLRDKGPLSAPRLHKHAHADTMIEHVNTCTIAHHTQTCFTLTQLFSLRVFCSVLNKTDHILSVDALRCGCLLRSWTESSFNTVVLEPVKIYTRAHPFTHHNFMVHLFRMLDSKLDLCSFMRKYNQKTETRPACGVSFSSVLQ